MHRKHHSVVRALRNNPAVLQRFWQLVKMTDDPRECWEWLGPLGPGGYPTFHVAGRTIAASHVTWFTSSGEFPEGGRVNRRCGNSRCVRPNHLVWALSQKMERLLESLADGYVALPGHTLTPTQRSPLDPRVLRALAASESESPAVSGSEPNDSADGAAAAA
jgi:hypothetical protein